jgi:hypothetical protein
VGSPTRQTTLSFGPSVDRLLRLFKVDFSPDPLQPSWVRVAVATVVSMLGSLGADALLVALGTRIFPSTKGYSHFQFHDYAELTVIGVTIACAAWPIVTRVSSEPRWLFFRMAIAVTLVLFVPDLWIYLQGSPGLAVDVLLGMHLAIALVTYNALVHIAPVGGARPHRS